MEELGEVVRAAQGGDLDAFAELVRRFQDMAYASAYVLTGDYQLAEDAAQEAFLQAYVDLPTLREPAAFPGWFRRIVFKHGDRLTRGKRGSFVPLDDTIAVSTPEPGPPAVVEERELRALVQAEIDKLPERERVAVTLFYLSGHAQTEIAAYLETPVSTVKKRLYDARRRLMRGMLATVRDTFHERRPSLDERFVRKLEFLIAVSIGDVERVERLLVQQSSLATTVLTVDDWRQAGAVRRQSLPMRWGYTPLHLAATYGYVTLVDALLARGADLDAATCGETPLHRAVMVDDEAMVAALLRRGAAVDAVDAKGMTPLMRAVINRRHAIVGTLLAHGASVATRDKAGRDPLQWAALKGDDHSAMLIAGTGVDPGEVDAADRPGRVVPATWVGDGALERVLDARGAPIDGRGPLPPAGAPRALSSRRARTSSGAGAPPEMLVTGMKVVDLLAPLRRGGTVCLSGATGVGLMATLGEWTQGLAARRAGCAVFLDWPARPVQVDDLVREWREQGVEGSVAMVLGHATDTDARRHRALLAGLDVAERFRAEGRDVLFVVAATEVEWRILSRLRDRLPCAGDVGSITLVLLDIWWDGAPTVLANAAAWDSRLVLDAALAKQGFHPAVDPLASGSRLLEAGLLGEEHMEVARQARLLSRRRRELLEATARHDHTMDTLSPDDRRLVARARRLQRFLTQPLFVKEAVTGIPGAYVPLDATIAGVAGLLAGRYDEAPEDAFLSNGTIDRAREKTAVEGWPQ